MEGNASQNACGATHDWQIVSFREILDSPVRNGIYKQKQFHGRGTKFVNMGELFAFPRLGSVPMKRVELSQSEVERFSLQRGDLLFARRSLTPEGAGKCCIVTDLDEVTSFESSLIRACPNRDMTFPMFLYYLFSSKFGSQLLGTILRQVAVSGITGKDLEQLAFPLPPLPEQRAIAHILGTLDDKIDLNRRMNETLEGIARALFKSWFVDFDPVRTKAEGRQPVGMDADTASLFPESFQESELGLIPAGWRVTSLREQFRNDKGVVLTGPFGSNLHSSDYRPSGTPLLLVKHIGYGSINEDGVPLVGEHLLPDLTRYRLRTNDIVFTRVGAVGRSCLITSRHEGWLFSGQTLRVRIPDPLFLNPQYLSMVYTDPSFIRMVESFALGSTRPSLNTNLLLDFRFLLPQQEVQDKFGSTISVINDSRYSHTVQSAILAGIRDTLLPKLISGQLRVPDAEKLLAESP